MSHNPDPRFATALATFVARAQKLVDAEETRTSHTLECKDGRRYVLVLDVHYSGPETSRHRHERAFCFVDKTSGAVLKPETWKKPHPTPRGTIYSDKLEGVNALGALYLPAGKTHTHTGPDTLVSVEERA